MVLVTFKLADKEYALDIGQVCEIIRMREIISIPDSADFVEGVMNLRGKVIPLISLRKKFGLEHLDSNRLSRIIISQLKNGHFMGVVVDAVSDVITLHSSDITPPDDVLKKAKYLIGVGRIGKRLILIADIEKLLTAREITGIKEVHGRVQIKRRQKD